MSQQTQPNLSVGCVAQNSKTVLSEGLCDLFVQEMATAFPGRTIARAPAQGQGQGQPDVVLVIEDATASRFTAHIAHGGQTGPSLATARKGAPLDDVALSTLMRGLIESTPNL
ncbi:MAG: hypothetical protein AB8B82_15355 [Roseovarius sp.]